MSNQITKCKTCGNDVAKGAKSCPNCGKDQRNFFMKHKIISIILILIILGGIGGALGDDEPKPADTSSTPAVTEDSTDNNDKETSKEASKEEKTTFGVNEPAELNNIIVTLNGVTESKGSAYNEPSDGNVFLIPEFTIENNSDKEINISSMLSFASYVDGYSANLDLGAMIVDSGKNQLDGTIAPGMKMNGVIGVQAPSNWSEIEIHVQPDFWSGKDFKFKASK